MITNVSVIMSEAIFFRIVHLQMSGTTRRCWACPLLDHCPPSSSLVTPYVSPNTHIDYNNDGVLFAFIGINNQTFWVQKCVFRLIHQFKHMFLVLRSREMRKIVFKYELLSCGMAYSISLISWLCLGFCPILSEENNFHRANFSII